MSVRVRVIGCGNPDAGDDALGLAATRELRSRLGTQVRGVDIVEAGPALAVLDLLDDAEMVFVVDAVRTPGGRRAPGTIVWAEAGPDGLPTDLRSSLSSHGIGVAEAVGLAAALERAPRILFLGVEVADVTAGHGLSPAVARALQDLLECLETEVRSLLTEVLPP